MADRTDSTTANRSRVNGFAQVMERIGLTLVGALCGLFVAALVGKANIEDIQFDRSAAVGGAGTARIGFYMGINIPSLPPGAPYRLSLRQRFASGTKSDRG